MARTSDNSVHTIRCLGTPPVPYGNPEEPSTTTPTSPTSTSTNTTTSDWEPVTFQPDSRIPTPTHTTERPNPFTEPATTQGSASTSWHSDARSLTPPPGFTTEHRNHGTTVPHGNEPHAGLNDAADAGLTGSQGTPTPNGNGQGRSHAETQTTPTISYDAYCTAALDASFANDVCYLARTHDYLGGTLTLLHHLLKSRQDHLWLATAAASVLRRISSSIIDMEKITFLGNDEHQEDYLSYIIEESAGNALRLGTALTPGTCIVELS
jgi:hypothetical protein